MAKGKRQEHTHEEANRQFDPTESRDINLGMGRSSIRQQTSSMGPSPGMSGQTNPRRYAGGGADCMICRNWLRHVESREGVGRAGSSRLASGPKSN
jgi:hypothetical protein